MQRDVRARFWVEVAMLIATIALLVVTLLWRDWIEIVSGIDPDEGSGSLEWLIVAACGVVTIVLLGFSSSEWRRSPRVERASSAMQP